MSGALPLVALALLFPACATDGGERRPEAGFGRLGFPVRVRTPAPAEEIVSAFDESVDQRLLPGAARPTRLTRPAPPAGHAGTRRLHVTPSGPQVPAPVMPDAVTMLGLGGLPRIEAERIADRHMRLVELAPWRAGVELFSVQGLSLLVGAQSMVDESERDPVSIERPRSAFDGGPVAVFGLRLRY
jgi:hypothetical protein